VTNHLILVVIYKQAILESLTLQSLFKCQAFLAESSLVIWDNSPSPQPVPDSCRDTFAQVHYHHTPDNKALSYIYNCIINTYSEHDLLVLLDQDSNFDELYFKEIADAAKRHPDICLFLPLVKSGSTIVSPGNYFFIKGSHWTKERSGLVDTEHLVAINSGMVIRFSYLQTTFDGYDERLNFYGVDIYFMRHFAQHQSHAFVLPYVIQHDSALLSTTESLEKRLFRFKDRLNAWKLLHEGSLVRSLLVRLYSIFVAAKLSLRYRSLTFLGAGVKHAFSR